MGRKSGGKVLQQLGSCLRFVSFALVAGVMTLFGEVHGQELPSQTEQNLLSLSAEIPGDAAPFFLARQKWTSAPAAKNAEPLVRKTSNGDLEILVGGSEKSSLLTLHENFSPLFASDHYLFLKLNGTQIPGIFYISQYELLQGAASAEPVAVYFMPFPEFQGELTTMAEIPALDSFLLKSSKAEHLVIYEDDLLQMHKLSRFNLLLSLPDLTTRSASTGPLLPTPYSTGFHGTVLKTIQALSFHSNKSGFFSFIPSAHADFSILATPELKAKVLRFVTIAGAVLVTSVILKYTLLKEKLAAKRKSACEDALTDKAQSELENKKSLQKKILTELKEVGDVNATVLMVLFQFPTVWFAESIQFLGDRYLPSVFSSEHSPVRKFLEKTVYFTRDINSKIPVNYLSWITGALFLGGLDTVFYYYELYYLVPVISQFIGNKIPALKSRIDEAYKLGNTHVEEQNQYLLVRCISNYYTFGSATLSQDIQGQFLQAVRTEVKTELEQEGKNPNSPNSAEELERRIKAKLYKIINKMGLPGPESFLFDASTLFTGMTDLLGYKDPQKLPQNLPQLNLFTKDRKGLIIPALKAASQYLKEARDLGDFFGNSPSEELMKTTTEAIAVLTALEKDFKSPLTPQYSAEAIAMALNQFEKSYNAIAHGQTDASPGQQWAAVKFARLEFLKKHQNEYLELTQNGRTEAQAELELKRKYFLGFHSEISKNTIDLIEDKRAILAGKFKDNYYPKKLGLIAKWQLRHAFKKSQSEYYHLHGEVFDPSFADEAAHHQWKEIFAKNFMNAAGLSPVISEPVYKLAQDQLQIQIESEPGLKSYLSELDETQYHEKISTLFAEQTIRAYIELTKNNDKVSAIDPAQPGAFQKFRQTRFVRSSKILTRTLRALEATMGEDGYRLGFSAFLQRKVPFYSDFTLANSRAYRGAFTSALANYPYNALVWNAVVSAPLWTLSLMTRFTITGPNQVLNRLYRFQGMKPLGGVSSLFSFAVVSSLATFWGSIPSQIFAQDFVAFWDSLFK